MEIKQKLFFRKKSYTSRYSTTHQLLCLLLDLSDKGMLHADYFICNLCMLMVSTDVLKILSVLFLWEAPGSKEAFTVKCNFYS
jgi:hypothetical protein